MNLDEKQALEAMRHFLNAYWERGGRPVGGDLGGLLGDIGTGLWEDGTPNDPAMWPDWLDAINAVLKS